MSRSVFNIDTQLGREEIVGIISAFMLENGFKSKPYKGGDMVWKRGDDFFVRGMYLATVVEEHSVHVEAWVKTFGESNLNGFAGFVPKIMLKRRVERLTELLTAKKDA